jgi:hypothetical protein
MNSMKRNKPAVPESRVEKKDKTEAQQHIFERPDGFYWLATDGTGERGPFTTLAEAEIDMQAGGESDLEAGDLLEAESDIGVSEWIDPDTGGPAEDSVPRIEDH